MSDQEVAGKAIDLYEAITELFNKVPDIRTGEGIKEYNTSMQRFGGIYTVLIHERFNLERIRLETLAGG